MMKYDEHVLREQLKQHLTAKRYLHSDNVCKRAGELALIHGADMEHARFAGLMHDICKNWRPEEQLAVIREGGIELEHEIISLPQLYHAVAGFCFLKSALNVKNFDILNSVRYHTTGRRAMSLLEKVIFLADLTSEDRDYPDIKQVRRLADRDLNQAMLYCTRFSISMLIDRGMPLCRDTWECYNEYVLQSQGGPRT